MRQLFTWRFVAAVVALAVLALVARGVLLGGDDPIEAVIDTELVERQIDLIEPVGSIVWSEGFEIGFDGLTRGYVDLLLSGDRVMRVAPGTIGEIECTGIETPETCAVFADMLGDAVVWFSIQPRESANTVRLPAVVDLDEGDAVLANGWRIPYPPVIERDCPGEDIPTFTDFLRRFGPGSTSVVDLTLRQVVEVRCGAPVAD